MEGDVLRQSQQGNGKQFQSEVNKRRSSVFYVCFNLLTHGEYFSGFNDLLYDTKVFVKTLKP